MTFYKKHSLLFQPDHQWEIDEFGCENFSKGDCISNSMKAVKLGKYVNLDENMVDISTAEALQMIWTATELIRQGKRWPDALNHPRDSKNWLQYQWSKMLFKAGITKHRRSRSQGSMTKDPIIYTICAARKPWSEGGCSVKHLGDILEIGFPWWTYRPAPFAWRKYMITREQKYKRRYEFWEAISLWIGMPEFALRTSRYMAEAAGSEKVLKMLK